MTNEANSPEKVSLAAMITGQRGTTLQRDLQGGPGGPPGNETEEAKPAGEEEVIQPEAPENPAEEIIETPAPGTEVEEEEGKEIGGGEAETEPKTVEEATKALKDAKQRVRDATTESARLKAEKLALQAERDALVAKYGEATTQEAKNKIIARLETAARKIAQFDDQADVETYVKGFAAEWGGAIADSVPGLVNAMVSDEVKRAVSELRVQMNTETAEEKRVSDARAKAAEMAQEAGLNMKKGSVDYKVFWRTAAESGQEGETFEDQVKWTISEVKSMKAAILKDADDANGKAEKRQREDKPLPRTSAEVVDKAGPEKPLSLTQTIERARKTI